MRGARRRTTRRRHDRCPVSRSTPADEPRLAPDAQHLRAAGRRTRSASASTTPRPPVIVVTMADGSDDPMQIDQLARLVERGVVVAAASRYAPGGQQVGGPSLKGAALAAGRPVAVLVRPGRHPRRHQLVQGLLDRASCARSASSPTPASRSGIELVAKARRLPPARRRAPHDLARPPLRRVELQAVAVAPRVPALVPLSPSDPHELAGASVRALPSHRQRSRRDARSSSPARPGSSAATSSRSCSPAATTSSGSTTSPSTAGVTKRYDDHPRYRLVEGDARDVGLMTELLLGLRPLHRRRRHDRRHLATSTPTPTTCSPPTSGSSPPRATPPSRAHRDGPPAEGHLPELVDGVRVAPTLAVVRGPGARGPAAAVVLRVPEAGRRVLRPRRLRPVRAPVHDRAPVQLRRHRRGPGPRRRRGAVAATSSWP